MRIALIVFALLFFACGRNETNTQDTKEPPGKEADTRPYYDFTTSIRNDIQDVLSTPGISIFKIMEDQGRKDSVRIDTTRFREMTQPFFDFNINQPDIKKEYKESVFEEPDTRSFVFNYTTDNESLPVKSVSIMVDTEYQDFKRVDLIKAYEKNDSLVEERMAWVKGKSFQLVRLASRGAATTKEVIIVSWKENK